MTYSVLFGYVMVQNRIFWTIGEQSYCVYYPLIAYLRINIYRVETIDMGISHWNSSISETVLAMVLV